MWIDDRYWPAGSGEHGDLIRSKDFWREFCSDGSVVPMKVK